MIIFDELHEGMVLETEEGLGCLAKGSLVAVNINNLDDKDFYVICENGEHFLDGQLDSDGNVVGFSKWD